MLLTTSIFKTWQKYDIFYLLLNVPPQPTECFFGNPYHKPVAEGSSLTLLETTVMRVMKVNLNDEAQTKTAPRQTVLLVIIICGQLHQLKPEPKAEIRQVKDVRLLQPCK